MAERRWVQVHLLPVLVPPSGLRGAIAVAIDVLRATTTMITALAAGCTDIRPCGTVEEARELAGGLPAGRVLLGGERHNVKIDGFDLGNSPLEYTAEVCRGRTLVMTTTNGTRAVLRAAEANRVLVAGFVNFRAVCDQLRQDPRPVHIVCAGTDGAVTLEDTLLAGALVDHLCAAGDVRLNDSARLARDGFRQHGSCLRASLETSEGARKLLELDLVGDITFAAEVDRFYLAPELCRDPLRVKVMR
jgi:2-phosphosulfolactate phosphatase